VAIEESRSQKARLLTWNWCLTMGTRCFSQVGVGWTSGPFPVAVEKNGASRRRPTSGTGPVLSNQRRPLLSRLRGEALPSRNVLPLLDSSPYPGAHTEWNSTCLSMICESWRHAEWTNRALRPGSVKEFHRYGGRLSVEPPQIQISILSLELM
jgi:hypothetical protein